MYCARTPGSAASIQPLPTSKRTQSRFCRGARFGIVSSIALQFSWTGIPAHRFFSERRLEVFLSNGLIVRSSDIHAAGCYTTRLIRKGRRVCEYDGPRMPKKVADLRYADRVVTYLFGYGEDNMVIDGFGAAMFMNHCCEPNCETREANERIFVVALRDIAAGEELVYEYNLWDSDDVTQDCFCGTPSCRGTMFSPAEVDRRAKLAKRKTKLSM